MTLIHNHNHDVLIEHHRVGTGNYTALTQPIKLLFIKELTKSLDTAVVITAYGPTMKNPQSITNTKYRNLKKNIERRTILMYVHFNKTLYSGSMKTHHRSILRVFGQMEHM